MRQIILSARNFVIKFFAPITFVVCLSCNLIAFLVLDRRIPCDGNKLPFMAEWRSRGVGDCVTIRLPRDRSSSTLHVNCDGNLCMTWALDFEWRTKFKHDAINGWADDFHNWWSEMRRKIVCAIFLHAYRADVSFEKFLNFKFHFGSSRAIPYNSNSQHAHAKLSVENFLKQITSLHRQSQS